MKKILLPALIFLLSISLIGCSGGGNQTQSIVEPSPNSQQPSNASDEALVTGLVKDFGRKLQSVSLSAPEDLVQVSLHENYSGLVSTELLTNWQSDPQNAPGRLVSSPWPDRIEIVSFNKISEKSYEVKGEIIEITSTEKKNGGIAAKRPITLVVEKINNHWLINAVKLGAYEETSTIVYKNIPYGFDFYLPQSWKNYTIITGQWEGFPPGGQVSEAAASGPMISIRHPLWTEHNQRQDIPILVFTLDQWNSLQQEKFHIGAAPMGPSELSRNNKYVFALPARYNYAFPTGFEEVENILDGNPLQPITLEH
ncbi:hypothetical protein SPSYN_01846 [Sporotomaculum syntrophicum]|uniref:Uncharacterized protein n=1 Tax=Sporotomaculum syntrophicum TaxID=182264 RepID=A0A9D2WRB7_9FIRM|nr:hypothetical protein [Sporotomaculum syntrophicum]KAF1085700.1 hypothetical protein SPSYN_01846 [Sporotomaculum syntrophicum]